MVSRGIGMSIGRAAVAETKASAAACPARGLSVVVSGAGGAGTPGWRVSQDTEGPLPDRVGVAASPERPGGAASLAAIALAGHGITAVLTALLARRMSAPEFEAYAVAVALYLVLVALVPLGADKLALRILPPALNGNASARTRSYLLFALRRLALGTLAVGAIGAFWAFGLRDLEPSVRSAVAAGLVVLPLGAAAQLGLEVLVASGRGSAALTIVRIVVPALVLAAFVALLQAGAALSGQSVILAWGVAWTCAVAAQLALLRGTVRRLRGVGSEGSPAEWRRASRPLLLYRIALGLMTQSSVLALDWLGGAPVDVGAYAASSTLVGLMLVLSTTTSRHYASRAAILLERRDVKGLHRLSRQRLTWLLPTVALFTTIGWAFTDDLLRLFNADFVGAGRWPLRILLATAAVTMGFGLAPTLLKYRDRNRAVFGVLVVATATQIVLLALLVPRWLGTGAALSVAGSSLLLYGSFAWIARGELRRLGASDAGWQA